MEEAAAPPSFAARAKGASTHVVRRQGVIDTAFNHELNDLINEDDNSSDDSDDESPETKDQYFEFTNSYHIMRLMRMIFYIQIISIAMDNPSLEFAVLFRICCRAVLYYSIRFYSRPFTDLVYVVQYFYEAIVNFFLKLNIPKTPSASNVEITMDPFTRRLNANPYSNSEPKEKSVNDFRIDFIDDRNWHAIKLFAHYYLGLFFAVMVVLFILRFWEISDYSNRSEIKDWLMRYVADGWWRRGGFNVARSVAQGLLGMLLLLLLLNMISTQLALHTIPENRIVGAVFAVGVAVVAVIWLLGYIFIKFSEAAFVRYVSQNVSYTSSIILKRVIKAKLDIGLLLMCCIYTPLVYFLVQSVTLLTDWNDALAPQHRKDANFFVPCYFQAFPPYRQQELSADSCPVAQFSHPQKQQPRPGGFYDDANILSCDTLQGTVLFVMGVTALVYAVLGFFYIIHSMLALVSKEFKESRFVDILEKLIRIREEELREYNERFPASSRYYYAFYMEIRVQLKYVRQGFVWVFKTVIRVMKGAIRAAIKPIKAVLLPIKFLLERLFIVSCLNFTTAEARKAESMNFSFGIRSKSSRKLRVESSSNLNNSSNNNNNNSSSNKMNSNGNVNGRPVTPVIRTPSAKQPGAADLATATSDFLAISAATTTAAAVTTTTAAVVVDNDDYDARIAMYDTKTKAKRRQTVVASKPSPAAAANNTDDDDDDLSAITPPASPYKNTYRNNNNISSKLTKQQSAAVSFRSNGIALDDEFMNETTAADDEDPFSFSSKLQQFAARHDICGRLQSLLQRAVSNCQRAVLRSNLVVWLKIQSKLFILRCCSSQQQQRRQQQQQQQGDDEFSVFTEEGLGKVQPLTSKIEQSATLKANRRRGVAALSVAALGGPPAQWRIDRTLQSKFRLLRRLKVHIINELRQCKVRYAGDHDLLISVLDHTIDSAGLLTLAFPYEYDKMHFFLVLCLEITLFAILGSLFNVFLIWQSRIIVFLVMNNAFALCTYFIYPYTEDIDKWLEFMGRMLINYVLICTLICADLQPRATNEAPTKLYEPWNSLEYITGSVTGTHSFGIYQILDMGMVFYFYCYIIYILYAIGAFGVVERMVESFQFGYHDHVLNFLVDALEEKTFGLENVHTGMQLIQQWDDVIKLQRRYALLSYPDVRPLSLVSASSKWLEIKWAAMFNLTLRNLRSSLGLSVLHTVMYAANGDIARWIIHTNPSLLHVEDSQDDTPITIALKECAYFLLAYGEQNGGYLDDNTMYTDEQYAVYYPEIDDVRDEVFDHGEFVQDLCEQFLLTSADLIALQEEGVYREPVVVAAEVAAAALERGIVATAAGKKISAEELHALEQERMRKKKARRMAAKAQEERLSINAKRFPEDDLHDDFESGQMSSWATIGITVPEDNLFMDHSLYKRLSKDEAFSYVNPQMGESSLDTSAAATATAAAATTTATTAAAANAATVAAGVGNVADSSRSDSISGSDDGNGSDGDDEGDGNNKKRIKSKHNATAVVVAGGDIENNMKAVKTTAVVKPAVAATAAVARDLLTYVRTAKRVHEVDPNILAPLSHDVVKGLIDWDKRPKRKRRDRRASSASNSQLNDSSGGDDSTSELQSSARGGSSRKSIRSLNSDILSQGSGSELISALTRVNKAKLNQETRWRICKFAEILMSEEIAASCSTMKWNIADFKAFNKLASAAQGRAAQNLAMVCHLNAPPGFVRISDWSQPEHIPVFDQPPDTEIPMIVKGVVALFDAAERVINTVNTVVQKSTDFTSIKQLRGRARRSRRSTSRSFDQMTSDRATSVVKRPQTVAAATDGDQQQQQADRVFSDRMIHYLAEALVCSSTSVELDDCELSYDGRLGWRAIARALRRKYCSFVLPSVFVPAKPIRVLQLSLTRNELDCGDAVLIADVLLYQRHLKLVDLSHNRIGARGMNRMAKAVRDHPLLEWLSLDHNVIGPGAGKDIGLLLKKTTALKYLSLSHNRMGEIICYPTLYSRQKIASAAHDIFLGLRSNKSLQHLDLSYNHLGPESVEALPAAVNRHPNLHTLSYSGNDLGEAAGSKMIFLLSGLAQGTLYARQREEFIRRITQQQNDELNDNSQQHQQQWQQEVDEEDWLPGMTAVVVKSHDKHQQQKRKKGMQLNQRMTIGVGYGIEDALILSAPDSPFRAQHPLAPATGELLNSPSQPELLEAGNYADASNKQQQQQQQQHGKKKQQHWDSSDSVAQEQSTVDLSHLVDPDDVKHPTTLTSLSLADNQLGPFAGHAIASLLDKDRTLTHLDISGNALGHSGGMLVADKIEYLHGIKPREFLKIVLWEIEEGKFTGRNAKKRTKIYTNLTSLDMSRNGLGPNVVGSLFHTLGNANCSVTSLDLSDNPLGYAVSNGGDPVAAGIDMRNGLMTGKSIRYLNLNRGFFKPVELVPFLGGLAHSSCINRIELQDIQLDEPSCLQLTNALDKCPQLQHVDLKRCRMGAVGSTLVARRISELTARLEYVDLTENFMGPVAAIYIGEALRNPDSTIHTMRLAANDLIEEGGNYIAKSIIGNIALTDLDLSGNFLTHSVAVYVADAARGLFVNGRKVTDSKLKRLLLNDNPQIGYQASKVLVKALSNDTMQHLELRNIGAKPGAAKLIASAVRDPVVAWRYLDVTQNELSRVGLNQIFWAMRQNKRMRILRCGDNQAGTLFCSNDDALLRHGISVPQFLRSNVVIRELDLSFNAISTEAGFNILDAMIDNHSIKKLSLRGNMIDDSIAVILPDLLRCNNVLEELDMGHNKLGFSCAFALAESLEINRSLRVLLLDYNEFGGAGSATLDAFSRSIMMNYTLQVLNLDGNKLGPQWGVRLAETFARNNTLLQVSLRDNRLDSRAGKALLKSFSHCKYMLELALSMDEVGIELWDSFRVQFEIKRASTHPDNYLDETRLTVRQSKLLNSYAAK